MERQILRLQPQVTEIRLTTREAYAKARGIARDLPGAPGAKDNDRPNAARIAREIERLEDRIASTRPERD
jgi:hypothetical protein